MSLKMKSILIIGSVLALVAAGIMADRFSVLNKNSDQSVPRLQDSSIESIENFWSEWINTYNGKVAYEMFKKSYADESFSDKHSLAHIFGKVLYTAEGLSAIGVCDQDFSYGCYHEFITVAIIENGLVVLDELNEYCTTQAGCQHGIGHGLLAYFGYDQEDLSEALALCEEIESTDPLDGCFGGIFMEYNARTMLSADGSHSRELTPDNTAEVCDSVPDYAVDACLFWLPAWWITALSGDMEERFNTAALMCGSLPSPERHMCVNGLGSEILSYTTNPDRAIRYCELGFTDDEPLLKQCLSSAASGFYTSPQHREMALKLCEPVNNDQYCIDAATKSQGKRIQPLVTLE